MVIVRVTNRKEVTQKTRKQTLDDDDDAVMITIIILE